jgi:hypothetical protein
MDHFRPSRGLAALASLLAVATLATPAHAATYRADIVTSIADVDGDVTDEDDAPLTEARADVTSASVEYRPGEISFTLKVARPSDPRTDTNWADGASFALWALDTNADQEADFLVSLVNAGGVLGAVVLNPDMEPVCFGSGTFDGVYGAVIPSSCVGNPAAFGWGAGIFYKTSNGTVAVDGAPDGDNLAGPIAAPLPLNSAAGGYWLAGDDGGIFSFNAPFLGSTGDLKLNKPIVGMAADPDKKGYWFVASDGGIFAYEARFAGSTGAMTLNKPIVGMASTPPARATGSSPPTAASSPSATPASSAPPAPSSSASRSSAWPPPRREGATGSWPPTAASSPSATPGSSVRSPGPRRRSSAWRRPGRASATG